MAILVLSVASPLAAQSLGDAAAGERARRETAAPGSVKTFTNADLPKPMAPAPPEPASYSGMERVGQSPQEAARLAAYTRHLASTDTYLRQAESSLRLAEQQWVLVTWQPYDGRKLVEARRRLDDTSLAFERARHYRNRAAIAARRAGIPEVSLK